MITKQDYLVAALVGFLAGVFAIPTLVNLGIRQYSILMPLPLAIPVLWVLGIWLGKLLSRWLPFMAQFAKFVAVGFLNAAIDFGVLNFLSLATGITGGFIVGGVNIPGFALAVTNGYFWNKFWVFSTRGGSADGGGDRDHEGVFHDFPKFIAVSVTGALVNSAIVVLLTTFVVPQFGVQESTWLNIAKALASAVALFWNFAGYKFFVFNARTANDSSA